MNKNYIITISLAIPLLLLVGCYSYPPPPKAVDSNYFTTIIKDEKVNLPSGRDILTLKEAEQIAVKNNPNFIAAKHAMAAAWQFFYISLTRYLPTSTGSYSITASQNQPRFYRGPFTKGRNTSTLYQDFGIKSQWLIFDGLMRTMNMLAARHTAKQYEELKDDAHRILLKSVATAYNNILLSKENINIAQADYTFNMQLLKETKIKYDAGAVPLTDVLNFQINATQSLNGLIVSEYNFRTNRYILAQLMGLTNVAIPEDIKFTQIDKINVPAMTDLDYYIDVALKNRPDLESFRQALKTSRYYLYSSIGSFFPTVSFETNQNWTFDRTRSAHQSALPDPASKSFVTKQGNFELDYGGSVQWDMFRGGQRIFDVMEKYHLVTESQYNLAQSWLGVVKEVRQAYDDCKRSSRQLKLFDEIQKASQMNRDLVEEEYKAGNTDITRLNQAQSDLIQAQANLASARINVLNSKVQLDAAIGIFDPSTLDYFQD